ncbi:8cb59fe5-0eb8-4ac9-b0a2-3efd34542900 [Sclerotinia trifoliorum]|uniref:8cb59fe5-0eb8-4ac9-b0a2-3efd34542900 n=1 Tax=Sclerotinia trifoliorum TaxID=28548 RepID=A0A8H2VTH6_9HELO|nr:8cb59fe5-0eb8-4ac9-b0a2-3efd34542900 [Sclerotinia trifoliorum]
MSLRVDDVEKPVMTDVVVFESLQVEASLVDRPESGEIVLNSRPGLDYVDTSAYCFHDWCYSIFSWRTKHKSAEFLYKLATSLKISSAWENPAGSNDPLYPQINYATLLSTVEDISARIQPQFLSRLPPELRYRIWNYVGSKAAYSAFMLVTGETTRLAQQISQPSVQDLIIEPDCYIEAGSIDIYGTGYIRDLTKKKEIWQRDQNLTNSHRN